MTYSHNSVSKNLKMTTAATKAAAASIRLKNGAAGEGKANGGSDGGISPPSTPPPSAHSNSIASNSTNFHHYHHHQPMLSSSPPGSNMSSAMSTSSSCSSSSSISSVGSNSSSGYFSSMRKQQRQQQQQRRSPQQQQHTDSGSYVSNNLSYQQPGSGGKRYGSGGGNSQKHRDGQRSPQSHHQQLSGQSPVSILGGGLSVSPTITSSGGSNSARKLGSKHSSPLLCVGGGQISPTHSLIPTAHTHFAGSKCFDAPAPNALPKPPNHWTDILKSPEKVASSAGLSLRSVLNAVAARPHHLHHDSHSCGGHVVKSSKRNLLDDFDTHNLKLLLNVQS